MTDVYFRRCGTTKQCTHKKKTSTVSTSEKMNSNIYQPWTPGEIHTAEEIMAISQTTQN